MHNSVALIIVDSSIPYYRVSPLHLSIEDLLLVAYCSWNGAVRDIMKANHFNLRRVSKEMI